MVDPPAPRSPDTQQRSPVKQHRLKYGWICMTGKPHLQNLGKVFIPQTLGQGPRAEACDTGRQSGKELLQPVV